MVTAAVETLKERGGSFFTSNQKIFCSKLQRCLYLKIHLFLKNAVAKYQLLQTNARLLM
jgi:hypothetical protein